MSTSELADLVRKAQAGDAAALNDLLRQLQSMVYYTALKLLGNAHDAEDAAQEVYIKILESLPQLRDPMTLLKWVTTITRNTCKNHLKKGSSAIFLDDADAYLDDLPEEADDIVPDRYMDMAAKREIILQMIDSLPEKQRLTVYLYYYNGNTVEEIAQFMEVSEGTVKSRLAAARASLRAQVEEEERKGNKLYVIFPFLGRLLREDADKVHLPPMGVTEAQVSAAAAGYAAAQAAGGAAAGAGTSAGTEQAVAETGKKAAVGAEKVAAEAGKKAAVGAEKAAAEAGKKAAAGGCKGAPTKAGTSLVVKIVAGVAATAVLIGGALVFSGAFRGGETQAPAPSPSAAAAVTPAPSPTPAPTSTPEPSPSPEPSAGVDLSGFDPLAILGQPLSAMTDILGEPTESDTSGDFPPTYRWYDAEDTYSIDVTMTQDGSLIRSVGVIKGASVLGVSFGDDAQAAQNALAGIADAQGVSARDAGGMTIYSAVTTDGQYIYQFPCAPEGFVTCGAVEMMTLPL